jgi:hypothetical protein
MALFKRRHMPGYSRFSLTQKFLLARFCCLCRADGYAAALGDGRGITFGRAGFTTGTGDGLAVVEAYVKLRPVNNTLAPYLPALEQQLAGSGGSAQVSWLSGGHQEEQGMPCVVFVCFKFCSLDCREKPAV